MKALKTLFLVLIVLVVVVIGGVAAFLAFLDPNDFKDQITAEVQKKTGRELTLDGPLELGLWPKIRLVAGPLALSNATGFSEQPFFAADKIQVAVATLPLLRNRLEMDTVVLHGLRVNIERAADGTTNYDDLAGDEAEPSEGGDGLAAIILGGVDIQDARFSYRDDTTGQVATISKLSATTGPLTFGDPVDFKLALTAVANQPALDSDIKLEGTVTYDLDNEHYVVSPFTLNTLLRGDHLPGGQAAVDMNAVVDINRGAETAALDELSITGLGTEVSGGFEARNIEDERPSASGKLEIAGKDLAALFNAFDLPVGKQLEGIKDRSFDFRTAFDADMDSGEVVVSALEGHILSASLGGSFSASKADTDEPSAKGVIEASGPDLPTLLAVLGQVQGADAETLSSLNQALRRAKDRSFAIKAELDADLSAGRADLPTLEARLLGNTINASINASNANSDKPAVKGSFNAKGPDFPTLATVISQFQGADAQAIKNLNAALGSAADKSFKVSADFDADMAKGTAELPKMSASLLGNTLSGSISARNIDGDKPAAKGSLSAKGGDLPAMLAIASQLQADGAALRDMGANLAREKDKRFEAEVAFDADLDQGSINLPTLTAKLAGITINGKLKGDKVDFEKGKGQLDGELNVGSKNLGPALRGAGQADLAKSLRTLDLALGVSGSLSALTLKPFELKTLVKSPELKKPANVVVTAKSVNANLDKDTLKIAGLSVKGLGLNAKAEVDAKNISNRPTFSGTLDVPKFDLKRLLAALNQPVPKTSHPKALKAVALGTEFSGSTTKLKLDNIRGTLDWTTLKGNINIVDFDGPKVRFDLNVDQIDIDRYAEPAPGGKGKGKAKAATPEAAAAGAASEIPVETLRALDIRGKLAANKLTMSGAKMTNLKFGISALGGLIRLKPLAAELYEGKYNGTIVLNAKGKRTKLNLDTGLNGVKVEPLLMDTVQNNMLAGTVSFNSKMRSNGNTPDQLKKSLTGKSRFDTENGIFRGVDAVAVLRAVEQILECKCPVPIPEGGETQFTNLGGTLKAKKGVVRADDLLLSGDGFKITGKGMLANLHDNTVKYNLELSVDEARRETGTANYNLGGYSVPVKCRGSLESPSCVPDAGKILKRVVKDAAKEKVEKAVGDKLKDAVGGEAGEALKQIFKF